MRKLTLVAALVAMLAIATAGAAAAHPFDRDGGGWRTYVLHSGGAIDVPAPPRNRSALQPGVQRPELLGAPDERPTREPTHGVPIISPSRTPW